MVNLCHNACIIDQLSILTDSLSKDFGRTKLQKKYDLEIHFISNIALY